LKNNHRHIKIIVVLLTLIILFNINGVVALVFGISGLLSPIYLILSIFGIFLLTKVLPKQLLLGYYLKLFFYFFCFYLVISFISGMINFENIIKKISWFSLWRSYLGTIFIIYFYYLSTVYFIYIEKQFELLKLIGVILLMAVTISGLLDYFEIVKFYDVKMASKISGQRTGGIFANPNELGAQATYSLSFMVFLFLHKKQSVFYFIGILLSVYMAIISFSKSAIIIAVFVLFFFVINNFLKFRKLSFFSKKKVFFFQLAVITLLIVSFLNLVLFSERIRGSLQGEQLRRFDQVVAIVSGDVTDENTSDRIVLANEGYRLISEHPIIGNGFGTFHRLKNIGLGVHNGYLMVLGEAGIFPFLLLLYILLLSLFRSFNYLNPEYSGLFSSLLIIFYFQVILTTHGAFEDRTFNALLGIIFGFFKMEKYVWNLRNIKS